MKDTLTIIFLTTLAVTLAQKPSWVATINIRCQSSGEKSSCLGAIISDDYLITAASCFSHCTQNDFIVRATVSASRIKVIKNGIMIHPNYATSQAANLALVKFVTPEFELTKVTITDKCRINNADSLSIITEKTKSPIQKYDNKECRELYKPNWQGSTQMCFTTTECVEKPGSFIEGDNTLFAMTTFNSKCQQGSNKTAALSVCKYHKWIKNLLTTPTGKISTVMSVYIPCTCVLTYIWLHCGLMISLRETPLHML